MRRRPRRAGARRLVLLVLLRITGAAAALAAQAPPAEVPPDEARGASEPEVADPDPTRVVPRVLFALPRFAFDAATLPLVGIATLEDEYAIRERVEDLLFDDQRRFGVFPTAFVETGVSPDVGLRVVHRDVFGSGEGLRLRGGYGGDDRQIYEAKLKSGRRGAIRFRFEAGHRREDRERFYGVGNADAGPIVAPGAPLDPFAGDVAIETGYRSIESWASATASLHPTRIFSLALSETWRVRRLDGSAAEGDEIGLDAIYDTRGLAGVGESRTDLLLELEASIDTRSSTRRDMPPDQPSQGWLARTGVAAQADPGLDDSDFRRVRLDLQRFFDLYRGDRVLKLRLYGVGLIGDLERIPFPDLAALGGGDLLRGHSRGRFRDRIAGLGSAEYRYPVGEGVSAYLFTDAGRVYRDLDRLPLDRLRVGFGGGLRIYGTGHTLLRLQIASSIDGGLFLRLDLHPDDDA